ncbi:SDR family oxidoreductase [Micromonospora sp. NPDC049047]|uniref:SDR family oxidoreductase n=1 Tax=Micromonospora sp. NPDC049047 TaxID=3155645 RepID=UPI0033E85D93
MSDVANDDHIAIVGMACRFPGANSPDEYWENLAKGVGSVTWLTDEELAASGVSAREYRHPHYVNAAYLMDDMEGFDARFFGYTPREAEVADPQNRWFLEMCHAAIEDSGYDPTRIDGLVGVVGGTAHNGYGEHHVKRNSALNTTVGTMAIDVGNRSDYLATTVSYRLGFQGPSINVQTACSTALLAIHTASQMLRNGECDYALAGGVEVELPYRAGQMWVEGSIYTRDGHIRPFDADASGTMFSTGVGVVALKRLTDAINDGDHVHAVLRGSAVNNDGGNRAGFTAPGVEGQAQLVVEALAVAEVHPDSIGFVEAHATGTLVGDPIEVAGLTRAYRAAGASGVGTIPIGSVKGNIGHLGPASGMAGLIKVCLAMRHGAIPPTINFSRPNPNLDLENSPFYVVSELTPWPQGETPRRAGVSSFGIGGTNVHVIVEEPPASANRPRPGPASRRWHTVPVSAKTASACEAGARALGAALAGPAGGYELGDVAYTAQVGRTAFPHRVAVAASGAVDASEALTTPSRHIKGKAVPRRIAMMFPGQGTQYPNMTRDLYDTEPAYRAALDECATLLLPHLDDVDLRELLFCSATDVEAAATRLRETRYSQPALFAVEYALATLLGAAGITPARMIGHSVGEYVAACLAGVFTLADALAVVAARGRLMQAMAPGAMLAVDGPAFVIGQFLSGDVEVAAVNGPRATVVAGTVEAVAKSRETLDANHIAYTALVTSHAFHTQLMEPCLEEFTAVVAGVPRSAPQVPFVSNVTGTWITDAEATDPAYWARHLRSTVMFADGITTVAADDDTLLVEVGPGDTLSRLARQSVARRAVPMVATTRHPLRNVPDDRVFAEALAGIWCRGGDVDWALWSTGRRVPLPGYRFERQPYFVEPDPALPAAQAGPEEEAGWPLPADRCSFVPIWREAPHSEPPSDLTGRHVLVFDSGHPVVAALTANLTRAGAVVTVARPGGTFNRVGDREFQLRPGDAGDMSELFTALSSDPPVDVVHALNLTEPAPDTIGVDAIGAGQRDGFSDLLHLGQQLAILGTPARVHVLSSNMQEISGAERLEPAKALLLGPVLLMQREVVEVTARSVDIALPSELPAAALARQLSTEIATPSPQAQVGWRGRKRWRLDYQMEPMDTPPRAQDAGGVYVITGGLGALGLITVAELADGSAHTVVLLGRSPVPDRADWPALIASPETGAQLRTTLSRLRAVEERGITVVPLRCDVVDDASLAAAVATVHERYGRIRGVFHSAGVAGGAMMAVRTDADAAAVLAPKVNGTLNLYRQLGDEVDFFVVYSSLTAATGTFGQVDYCAANNFLDAFARWAAQRDRPVYSIGWTQWTESGMSADSEAAAPQAFRELQTGARSEPAAHPLLDRRILAPGEVVAFSTTLTPGSHWIASEHRLGDREVVVGTGLLEMVDGAYREGVGGVPEIRDVIFLGPVGVTEPTEIRIELRPDGAGHDVVVTAATTGPDGPVRTERLRCQARPYQAEQVPVHDLEAIRSRCSRFTVTAEELRSAGGMIDHGPRWAGNIKGTSVGDREELSRVEMAEQYWPECGQLRLHPALLDTAVAEANYAEDRLQAGENYLPLGYGRIRAHEPLPPRFWVHIRHLGEPGAEIDRMTTILMHDDGQEIARIDEYAERRVDPAAIRAAVQGADVPVAAAPHAQTVQDVSITPELGRDVLRRILHWRPAPHLLVVPEGIHRNLRRTQAITMDLVQRELVGARLTGTSAAQDRLVETDYVGPETDLQRKLADLWGAALGIAQIGIDDAFLELGGNSLVAVQLASRMRDTLGVELPIAILFDHPTVRSLAGFLGSAA